MEKQTENMFSPDGGPKLGAIQCLGMTFPTDEARRAYFTEKLREKLKDPAFRTTEGFPQGEDEDILALSDPPYYTACPNPFLQSLLVDAESRRRGSASRQKVAAFADDVAGDKHGVAYNVHPYHTKVPPEAILPLLRHYTQPGDVILDPFAGTGMTGVAVDLLNTEDKTDPRTSILADISAMAGFISSTYTSHTVERNLLAILDETIAEVEQEVGKMFRTAHTGWRANTTDEKDAVVQDRQPAQGNINYTVWSDIYICPHCSKEVDYWKAAVRLFSSEVAEVFTCLNCEGRICKESKYEKKHSATQVQRCSESWYDPILGKTVSRQKRVPVLISYEYNGSRFEKWPDEADLDVIAQSDRLNPRLPTAQMMFKGEQWGDTWRAGVHTGITHVHQFFTNRTLLVLSEFLARTEGQRRCWFALTSTLMRASRLNRYMPQHRDNRSREVVGPLSGTLYVPAIGLELNLLVYLRSKRRAMLEVWGRKAVGLSVTTTQSSTNLSNLADCSVDYIFADPPFGDNLFYSELNFPWEWLIRCYSQNRSEAVVSACAQKALPDYTVLMTKALSECYRVLKPGRWITVEFHNSQNAVWTAIHEAVETSGFVVADVRTLDKKKGTTKQLTFANAVKQDLVISAYKPDLDTIRVFDAQAGTEIAAWEFVRNHLAQLPCFVEKHGRAEIIAERQKYLLFDRMVAFHVQRGFTVPMSASEFYGGLVLNYPERDGMYFLPGQVGEYERRKLEVPQLEQMQLFVSDERSAIQWVRQQLVSCATSYQDLQPLYMKEAQRVWEKHEQPIELETILDQNFVNDVDGLWRVPDPANEAHLEQQRSRWLLKEFQQYVDTKGKLKVVRTEALRSGFKEAWQKKSYLTIVQMAKRVPEAVIQEDQALLMYFDNASLMLGE
jgi:hypothetical protein